MKLTKKLLPAFGMLLLSACMMVTSTFAWFSMNTEVSATGMQVSAVGDQVYLQIVHKDTAWTTSEAHKSAAGTATTTGLIPAAVVAKTTIPDAGAETVERYTGGTYSWVTNNSNAVDRWQPSSKYTNADSTSYYLKDSFKIRLNAAAGQTTAGAPLRVSAVTMTADADEPMANCVSVLVVCGEWTQLWKQTSYNTWAEVEGSVDTDGTTPTANWGQLTAGNFADTTGTQVDIYVFFDGENTNCTTAGYSATLHNNFSVSVSFVVTAKN